MTDRDETLTSALKDTIDDLRKKREEIDEQIAEMRLTAAPAWARYIMVRLPSSEYDKKYDAPRSDSGELILGSRNFISAAVKADDAGIQTLEALIALIRWYQAGEPDDD